MANLTLSPVGPWALTLRVTVACTDLKEDSMKKTAAVLAAVVASTLGGIALAPQASAATSLDVRAMNVAKSKVGDPYRYGAAGPYRFDCSGLVYYSYKRLGKTLPRTAQSQYNHVHHISSRSRRPGDLVFFGSTHGIYHVGIYVGSGKIVNANTGSYRGRRVVVAPIREYGSSVHYGRV